MSLRRRMVLAAFLGGWLAQVVPAAEPARLAPPPSSPLPAASANQQLADTVAGQLRQSGQLRGYAVDVLVAGGTVELSGTVASQPQREEVLRIVQGVPGVERVVDRLRPTDAVVPVQAFQGQTLPGTLPNTLPQAQPGTIGGTFPGGTTLPPGTVLGPQPGGTFQGGPLPGVQPLPGQGGLVPGTQVVPGTGAPPLAGPPPLAGDPAVPGRPEPVPIFQAPGLGYNSLNPPRMPPYAWPTYAPYNNYSRVACPEAYPYNAWPFIGPIHPFPKIPLGWRSVKLTWDDGFWWYSRTATKHDWWRLRFY